MAASCASVATSCSTRRMSSACGADCALLAQAKPRAMSTAAARGSRTFTATASAHGPYDRAEQVLGELAAHLFADFQRIAEMDAAPDAYHPLLFGYLRNTVELTLQPGICTVGHCEHLRRSGAEHRFEDGRRNAGHDGRRRGIFGMHRRRAQRRPAGVSLGGIITVLIPVADRRHWSPTVVVKLRIPVADVVIGDTHVD